MNERIKMTIAPGALSALRNAGSSNTTADVESITLSGDLSQMGTMGDRLRQAGFNVRHSGVYPVIEGKEIVGALQFLWDRGVDGWWGQNKELVKHGICTQEEFVAKLDQHCIRKYGE
jgi:hypothetical protein